MELSSILSPIIIWHCRRKGRIYNTTEISFNMEESNFRFSFPDARKLTDNINPQEILSVFRNVNTAAEPLRRYDDGTYYYMYMIGFSRKKRFLQLFLSYDEERVNFEEVRVADEEDILRGYCRHSLD